MTPGNAEWSGERDRGYETRRDLGAERRRNEAISGRDRQMNIGRVEVPGIAKTRFLGRKQRSRSGIERVVAGTGRGDRRAIESKLRVKRWVRCAGRFRLPSVPASQRPVDCDCPSRNTPLAAHSTDTTATGFPTRAKGVDESGGSREEHQRGWAARPSDANPKKLVSPRGSRSRSRSLSLSLFLERMISLIVG